MSSTIINGDRTTPPPPPKSNGVNGEATDDAKATQQQHIKNLETELKHAREALAGSKINN